jgi:hypothetical protein
MQNRVMILCSLVSAAALLAGCEGEMAEEPSTVIRVPNQPTSVIDPVTGEPRAINTDLYPYTVREMNSEQIVPIAASRFSTWFRASSDLGGQTSTERYVQLPHGYVMTGVGGRVDGNGNFTDMTIEGRELRTDGTLGGRERFAHGRLNVYEAFAQTDGDYVIIGIGGRISGGNNLTTLNIWYRRLDPATGQLVGEEFVKSFGTVINEQANESSYKTSAPTAPELHKRLITGAGFTCSNENLARVSVEVGVMN